MSDGLDLVIKLLTIVAISAVGVIVMRLLKGVEEIKKLADRISRLEVKMDTLWKDRQ